VSSVIHGITSTFELFRRGRYYEAAHSLLPVLEFVITDSEEDEAAVRNVIQDILNLPQAAKKMADGATLYQREQQEEQILNTLAYRRYLEAVRTTRQAIETTILNRRRSASLDDFPSVVEEFEEE